jgi:acetyl-CoA C-acetyltransferase
MIQLGDVATAVAGGAESMSRAGYLLQSHRWGKRMGDDALVDTVTGALTDPFGNGHMGVTAENVARECGVTRSEQDMLAEESHRRAANAQEVGRFDTQIIPLPMRRKGEGDHFAHDEHVRSGLSLRDLEALKPVFAPNGTVTAGNASSINDGAAALTLASGNFVDQARLRPIARIVSYGSSGIAPQIMGLGPVDAVKQALERAKLSMSDIDVIEANEAFAAQAIAVLRELDMCPEKVNPNGGAIAMGHPVGATGSIILVKLLYELQRINGQYGLVTMCIGGGQGIALIVERV